MRQVSVKNLFPYMLDIILRNAGRDINKNQAIALF